MDQIDRSDAAYFSLFFRNQDPVAAINSVKKSSKSELSSRFFGRLKILVIFDFRDAHYLLHALTIENCDYIFTRTGTRTSDRGVPEIKGFSGAVSDRFRPYI